MHWTDIHTKDRMESNSCCSFGLSTPVSGQWATYLGRYICIMSIKIIKWKIYVLWKGLGTWYLLLLLTLLRKTRKKFHFLSQEHQLHSEHCFTRYLPQQEYKKKERSKSFRKGGRIPTSKWLSRTTGLIGLRGTVGHWLPLAFLSIFSQI